MSAQRKYPEELRERATRMAVMAVEARRDPERSKGAIRRIADELGAPPRGAAYLGHRKAEVDAAARPGTTSEDAERIRQLEADKPRAAQGERHLEECVGFFRGRCPQRPSR
ncbi:hypothetical protein [Actinomyces ruminis]|uniref:Transposase n=1 Tax=Actinomyces ruminis TaxID=1937003 RepID=A0ABX4MFT6_9ACTO|nr:hypothetical protein [Actinomyces ruminis]PHP53017.1 hypothetical protein BW737_005830 [Actinomyces ruminis]